VSLLFLFSFFFYWFGVQIRTAVAVSLLIGGKLLNVQVPYMFKMAIDSLSIVSTEAILVVPTALFFGYGAGSFFASLIRPLYCLFFACISIFSCPFFVVSFVACVSHIISRFDVVFVLQSLYPSSPRVGSVQRAAWSGVYKSGSDCSEKNKPRFVLALVEIG
jgi:hypothetical protein